MGFLTEFKAFSMKGNVVDLAVAVIIGTAFGKIVSALVEGVVMPLIGLLLGGIDISKKSFLLGHAVVKWGLLLQSVIDFTIIAFSIFLVIKLISSVYKKPTPEVEVLSKEVQLLTEIRDALKKTPEL
jgi:large conductance mechanosensitive channel